MVLVNDLATMLLMRGPIWSIDLQASDCCTRGGLLLISYNFVGAVDVRKSSPSDGGREGQYQAGVSSQPLNQIASAAPVRSVERFRG
jgi:hypothetical protein